MKIRSQEELIDRLSQDSAGRKKELIAYNNLIDRPKESYRPFFLRSAVVFSYAHWEGFVKHSSTIYLNYISFTKPTISEMTTNFHAICCRNKINRSLSSTKRIQPHLDLLNYLNADIIGGSKFTVPADIDTESNLNGEVLENICKTIGIDYNTRWASHTPFINDLVANRCAIAHGELIPIDESYAHEVIDFVLLAINTFKNDIENSTVQKLYMKSNYDAYIRAISTV